MSPETIDRVDDRPKTVQDGAAGQRWTHFKIAPVGSAWLQIQSPAEQDADGQIQVDSDFAVRVPAHVPLLDRFRVARFTSAEGIFSAETGPVFRYRITQTGLRRAIAQGVQVEMVLSFLQERADSPLPANVASALSRWAG